MKHSLWSKAAFETPFSIQCSSQTKRHVFLRENKHFCKIKQEEFVCTPGEQIHSHLPGHPEFHDTPGVEATTGPLGQGIANAVGYAVSQQMAAARFNTKVCVCVCVSPSILISSLVHSISSGLFLFPHFPDDVSVSSHNHHRVCPPPPKSKKKCLTARQRQSWKKAKKAKGNGHEQ